MLSPSLIGRLLTCPSPCTAGTSCCRPAVRPRRCKTRRCRSLRPPCAPELARPVAADGLRDHLWCPADLVYVAGHKQIPAVMALIPVLLVPLAAVAEFAALGPLSPRFGCHRLTS